MWFRSQLVCPVRALCFGNGERLNNNQAPLRGTLRKVAAVDVCASSLEILGGICMASSSGTLWRPTPVGMLFWNSRGLLMERSPSAGGVCRNPTPLMVQRGPQQMVSRQYMHWSMERVIARARVYIVCSMSIFTYIYAYVLYSTYAEHKYTEYV
jgi:hypothetical protein